MKKTIKVVAAIIENEYEEILCALRSPSMTLPNMWEFPGGKVERNESLENAIIREIYEELDCKIKPLEIYDNTTYEYDDVFINLICIRCEIISGVPNSSEHSELIWLKRENLKSLVWAPADINTINKLCNEK